MLSLDLSISLFRRYADIDGFENQEKRYSVA